MAGRRRLDWRHATRVFVIAVTVATIVIVVALGQVGHDNHHGPPTPVERCVTLAVGTRCRVTPAP